MPADRDGVTAAGGGRTRCPVRGSQAARAITDNAAHEVSPWQSRRACRREPAR
jgi:hypothetical protein